MSARVGVLIDYRSLLDQLEMVGLTERSRTESAQRIREMVHACLIALRTIDGSSTGTRNNARPGAFRRGSQIKPLHG